MIDFIKINSTNKVDFENNIKNNIKDNIAIDLYCNANYNTGEVVYPCRLNYNSLDVRITDKTAYIRNSLHKFYNSITENEIQNYNDFNYCNLCTSIDLLQDNLKINCTDFNLTNLEFGLNINTSISPSQIIENNLLMYNFEEFNQNDTFKGKGTYKQYNQSDYLIKVYDKGKQYGRPNSLIRIEIKIIKSRLLNKLGIYNLNDCRDKKVLQKLFNLLLDKFENLIIIDNFNSDSTISQNERILIEKGKSVAYWRELKQNKSSTYYCNKKKEFIELLMKNELLTLKDDLKAEMVKKYNELIEVDCNLTLKKIA